MLHAHILTVSPAIDTKALEQLFRHKVLKMLLSKGKITQDMIKLLDKWRHTGFNVYCGSRILPWRQKSMENLGKRLETKFAKAGDGIAKGFVVASLVFCVGSMAIVGSMESGLTGNHQTLFAKSALDGLASIIFASTFGIGVLFSSISVFVYQGFITITASLMKPFLIPPVINQMSGVGGLLIMAIGINLLEIKKIKVGNMLPAIFIPLIYYMLKQLVNFF